MSGLAYRGSVSIGAMCPIITSAIAAAEANVGAQLAGALQLSTNINLYPPSLVAAIEIVTNLLASLQAMIGVGWVPPSVTIAFAGELVVSLEAQLEILLELSALLEGVGILAYTYGGRGIDFGAAVQAEASAGWPDGTSPYADVNALLLVAPTPEVWALLQGVFGGVTG